MNNFVSKINDIIIGSSTNKILLGANLDDIIKIATHNWSIRNSSFQEYT